MADAGQQRGGQDEPQWRADQRAIVGRPGEIYLCTAGVPCQPASRAGRQRGAADDRWFWPEAVRALGAVKPAWALFENPPGIGDVGLAGVLAAVEAEGYEVRVLNIPACAVGAPHRRERYWIVAHRQGERHEERGMGTGEAGGEDAGIPGATVAAESDGELADAARRRQREHGSAPGSGGYAHECNEGGMGDSKSCGSGTRLGEGDTQQDRHGIAGTSVWANYVWLPCADGKLRRAPDDTFGVVDGLHRSVLAALGNSIVWPVAAEIIRAMRRADGL